MRALVLLALWGCSFHPERVAEAAADGPAVADARIAEDGPPPPSDAPPDAEVVLGDWGTPVLLAMSSATDDDDDPSLSADGLELYFASKRSGGDEDLFVSRRDSPAAPWSLPELVPGLNGDQQDTDPEITRDGLKLYFSSDRGGSQDVYVAKRNSANMPWGTPVPVAELSSGSSDYLSVPDAGEQRVLLQSDRAGGEGRFDVWEARWDAGSGVWEAPINVAELNTGSDDRTPWLSADGLQVILASDRPGGTAGSSDLYQATRPDLDAGFGSLTRLELLASSGDDADPTLSADQRYMVFMSDRAGSQDLYEVSR